MPGCACLPAGHHVGEFLPSLHATLCTFLGRCAAANASGLHLWELLPPPADALQRQAQEWQEWERRQQQAGADLPPGRRTQPPPRLHWPPWLDEATACFAQGPKTYIGDAALNNTVVRVRRLLVGVGPACRAHLFCNGDPAHGAFQPIPAHLFASYRERMAACLGFPAAAADAVPLPAGQHSSQQLGRHAAVPAGPRPRILLVSRPYSAGRSFLNADEMLEALQRRYGAVAEVEARHMEGLSLRWGAGSVQVGKTASPVCNLLLQGDLLPACRALSS